MVRLIVLLAVLFVSFDCSNTEAQTFARHQYSSPGYSQGPFGYNQGFAVPYPVYGYGYVYDPYARGRFEWPDPLDDPYLRAKYKYDTFFPGRRSRHSNRILRRR